MKCISRTRRIIFALVLVLCISFGMSETTSMTSYADTIVYVTKTGSKYHSQKCGNGTFSQTTLSNAKKMGLTPCQKCFPNGEPKEATPNPAPTPVKSIKLSISKLILIKGQKSALKISGTNSAVKWTTSNKNVAVVSNGVVLAKGKGNATITAKVDGVTKICQVLVETPELNLKTLKVKVGVKRKLTLKGCTHLIKWKSSNKNVLIVGSNGMVKGVKKGTASVTATVHGKTYVCKVTVTQ